MTIKYYLNIDFILQEIYISSFPKFSNNNNGKLKPKVRRKISSQLISGFSSKYRKEK